MMNKYVKRVGMRSFCFQLCGIVWTLLMFSFATLMGVATFPKPQSDLEKLEDAYYGTEGSSEVAWVIGSFICPGIIWFIGFVIFMILAIVTLETSKVHRKPYMLYHSE